MMGSLRNPAGWNNLYSLRPTAEWMEMEETADEDAVESTEGSIELPYPISTVGPMARCPEDIAMFLKTILPEGQTDFDASVVIDKDMDDLISLVKGSKIGWLADWGGSLPFENGVLLHCKRALDLFESSGGASIECMPEAPFPSEYLWESWMSIRSYKILHSLSESIGCDINEVVPILKARHVKPEAIWECECEISQTRQQLKLALDRVHEWSLCAEELFKSHDFLALPSSQVYPFDASIDWPKSIAGKKMKTYHMWMAVMVPVTLLGVPCVTIPALSFHHGEYGSSGPPMGIQVFAPKGKDAELLQLARWYHRNFDVNIDLAV